MERSANTLKTYNSCIKKVRAVMEQTITDFDFLVLDASKVCMTLDKMPGLDNSKKAYITSIKYFLKDCPEVFTVSDEMMKRIPEALVLYDTKFKEYQKKIGEKEKLQVLSESEKEKFLSWSDILALESKFNKTSDDKSHRMDYLIYCLYTMMPPLRADFAPMRVMKKNPTKDDCNYVVIRKNNPVFVLNEYKTKRTFGKQTIPIPPNLMSVIKSYCEKFPSDYLLTKESNDPMSGENLSQRVIRVFEKLCGKAVGISMLRHSYITDKRSGKELSLVDKEALAKSMLHSSLTNELYKRIDAE